MIGKKGADIDMIKNDIAKIADSEVQVNITDVRKAELEPSLVANSVATQLEKRVSFRKAVKKAIGASMKMGAKGIRINVKGRLVRPSVVYIDTDSCYVQFEEMYESIEWLGEPMSIDKFIMEL